MSAIVAVLLGVVVLAAAVAIVRVVPRYTERLLPDTKAKPHERFVATTELRRVVVEATVAILLLAGAVIAFSEYRATKERQDSERFAQVVELLGSADVPTQIGAVYGMEGVARSDSAYYPIVDDTLSALVRARAPYADRAQSTAPATPPTTSPPVPAASPTASPTPPPDAVRDPVVQAAVRVLGRVPHRADRRLDLSRSNLRGIDLLGGDFRNASFDKSNLYQVNAAGADLRGASFDGAAVGSEVCSARLGDNRGLSGGC